jgi:hypothetical protein
MLTKPDHMTEEQWAKVLEYIHSMPCFKRLSAQPQPQQPTGNQS